jgi:murein DD-endopeptidase
MKKLDNYQIPLILVGLGLFYINRKDIKRVAKAMLFPIKNKITSQFGNRINPITRQYKFHNGIDISGKVGEKIKSPADGKVLNVYINDIGGKQLIIKHENGFTTGYAHLNRIYVNVGDHINRGQFIAEVGNTGMVTGPHLHFTLKDNSGRFLNPLSFIELTTV